MPRILHIGGDRAGARLVREALAGPAPARYDVDWIATLADGLAQLATSPAGAVLLDLPAADCPGIEAVATLSRAFPSIPVLVVGADEHEDIARQMLQAGADDYLLRNRLDSFWLPRALAHAIKRADSGDASSAETERVGVTLNSIGDAMLSTDVEGNVTHLNRTAEVMTGWSESGAAGRPLTEVLQILDGATRESADPRRQAIRDQAPNAVPDILIRRDGMEYHVEHSAVPVRDERGTATGTTIVLRDVSAASAVAAQMSHLASHDPLTDLPNRLLLADRLARALVMVRRHQRHLAVLFLDIDRFKQINDSLGHMFGDELLRGVARGITTCVRSSDTVSRQGGDEFVIVLSELEHVEDAAVGARKIIAALGGPHTFGGHELFITVSIGISVYPGDGGEAETLLKNADMALYQAKEHGRNCYRFFIPSLNVRADERQAIEADLHHALARKEFELFYQPKVDLKTCAVVGLEALIRWRHPRRGLLEPADFIPIAEACGLITPIGRWVVHEACRQAKAWQDAGIRPMPVSVNVSAIEFRSEGFLQHIVDVLAQTRLEPCYLEIELTESVLMSHANIMLAALHALKALGVRIAIDDFGTGWSSLSYLRQFPIDVLKVDKSFLHEITGESSQAPIVSAVISMGNRLNHRVIAEGVETREQLAFLQAEDCGEGQGYYFSRPLVAHQCPDVVEALQRSVQK